MSAPLVPSPLDCIGCRRFAFYPPIKNVHPNEWVLGSGSWSEVQVVNARTGREIWIPRQYIGAVSDSHGPLLVVGLTKDLMYRAGTLSPSVKRVIEMPHAPERVGQSDCDALLRPRGPASVIGIRVENREDSPMNRALITFGVGALIVSLVTAVLAIFNSCAPSNMKRSGNQQPVEDRSLAVAAR